MSFTDSEQSNEFDANLEIRKEVIASGAGFWGQWRLALAWALVGECPLWVITIVHGIWINDVEALTKVSPLLMTWWGVRFGVQGLHVFQGSRERQAAMESPKASVVVAAVKSGKEG